MRVSVYDRLLLKFELARVVATALDAHGAIVVAVYFSKYDIVYRSSDLAPLKCFTIFKLQGEGTHRIKLNRTPPELAFEIRICPEFPASPLTVTSNNHRVVTHLKENCCLEI